MGFISVFRIANARHVEDLTGEGSFLFGGRWNSVGVRMLYTSSSVSLSILEVLVYTSKETLNIKSILELEIPDDSIKEVEIADLNDAWNALPSNNYTKSIGDEWIFSMETLALKVPSAVNPKEYNILINPLHEDFKKVRIKKVEKFSFDKRLLK